MMEISDSPYNISSFNTQSDQFCLYQNFPQTFYKITKIAFDLPEKTQTKLMIYDVFGRELKSLVDEELNAGSYEVKWNALNFSPGIYYYKMYAGSFVDSKKMILLNTVKV